MPSVLVHVNYFSACGLLACCPVNNLFGMFFLANNFCYLSSLCASVCIVIFELLQKSTVYLTFCQGGKTWLSREKIKVSK